jgi:hypothetical protein
MKKLMYFGLVLSGSASLLAQEERAAKTFERAVKIVGGQLVGSGVKASPYSAESVVETTQALADGNRIVNRSVTKQFRDSEGRERRETTVGEDQEILISDPVAGVSFTLRTGKKTAEKTTGTHLFVSPDGLSEFHLGPGPDTHAAGTMRSVIINRQTLGVAIKPEANQEDLGARVIEGVMARGTRVRTTIPAGQIGNEKPIEVTSETWFSPDLQMTVLSETNDPRTGKTVMRLTNINRAEPPRSLFEVPPDYTVTQGGGEAIRLLENLKVKRLEVEREVQRR